MKDIFKRIFVKLSSSKLWVTIWSMFLATYIVINKLSDFEGIAYMCSGSVIVYVIGNVLQKKIDGGRNGRED